VSGLFAIGSTLPGRCPRCDAASGFLVIDRGPIAGAPTLIIRCAGCGRDFRITPLAVDFGTPIDGEIVEVSMPSVYDVFLEGAPASEPQPGVS